MSAVWIRPIVIVFFLTISGQPGAASTKLPALSVFDAPYLQAGLVQVQQLLRNKQFDKAVELSEQMIDKFPAASQLMVIRSMLAIQQKDGHAALDWLNQAADAGYRDFQRIGQEPAFQPLHKAPVFTSIVTKIQENATRPVDKASKGPFALTRINPEARIGEGNTAWDARRGLFTARFTAEKSSLDSVAGKKHKDQVSKILRDLYRSGKAAGNRGDIYDNRDRGHSRLSKTAFPQIAHTVYDPAAKSRNLDMALNSLMFFDRPVIGNASLGVGGQWSLVRKGYDNIRQVNVLQLQYLANHLYVYPGVYDYAPKPKDNFTANTPYVVVSKGKSGSDRPFLIAMATGLAALPPKVKAVVTEKRMIAPVLQYLLRHGQKHVTGKDSYLSPKAHPVVMDGAALDRAKIIDLAQALRVDNLPLRPDMVLISEDDKAAQKAAKNVPGFTLPNAINRHLTRESGPKRLTISAALTEKQRTSTAGPKPIYHWVLLEGDPGAVSLTPRGEREMILDLVVPWRAPGPALNGEKVIGSRTDIGLFVERNGIISAPSIISVWSQHE